jgi:hypothetical protein
MAVYLGLLNPGDTVLGLSLDHGGHLTHGSPVNASGILYNFVSYKVGTGDERINMEEVRELALKHRPKLIVAGTTSYTRRLEPEPFKKIADEVGALLMFDIAHLAGLVPAERIRIRFPSPTSSRSPRTRRCADRAAAASSARPSTRQKSTRRSSPEVRVARSRMQSPERQSHLAKRQRRCSATTRTKS